jgi:hypothetical protein
MNDGLEKKLTEDLEKSGFRSEMKAIREFLRAGWVCTGFANYFDLDLETTRELDLHAATVEYEGMAGGRELLVAFYIDAEVKKSEKPWVVFKEQADMFTRDSWNNLIYCKNLPCEKKALSETISKNSIFTKLGWKAYGIHESFKKPEAPSRWYPAFVKVSKASEASHTKCLNEYEQRLAKTTTDKFIDFRFYKPVVILDGILVAANLTKSGDISLEEVKYAPLEFAFKSKNYQRGTYIVDIVTLNSLEEYIDICDDRHSAIFEHLKSLAAADAT